jgi:hypothetical protein
MSNQHRDIRDISDIELIILESLIDKRGIQNVLDGISAICDAKLRRLAETEQNAHVAKGWADLGDAIDAIVPKAKGVW